MTEILDIYANEALNNAIIEAIRTDQEISNADRLTELLVGWRREMLEE